jgi:hypothetical protein
MFRVALYARRSSGPDARMSRKATFAAAVAHRNEDRADRSMARRVTLRAFDALASCFHGDPTAVVRQLPTCGQHARPSRRRRP